MNKKILISQIKSPQWMNIDDQNIYTLECKKGSYRPFYASSLCFDEISIAYVFPINKKNLLIVFDQEGSSKISKFTLNKMMNMKDLDHVQVSSYSERMKSLCPISFVILSKDDYRILQVLSKIDELKKSKEKIIIGIDGFAASGKSTLATKIANCYDVNILRVDDFVRGKAHINHGDHGNHIQFEKLNQAIQTNFMDEQTMEYIPFDFKTHQHTEPYMMTYRPIMIVEGAYSFHPAITYKYDLRIFLSINTLKQYYRIYHRNGLKRLKMFVKKWIPLEKKYIKALKIVDQADVHIMM